MSNIRNDQIEALAAVFKALSNPQRLRMFLKLAADCADGSCCRNGREDVRRCVGELGEDLGIAASTVSHHLKELRIAGLLNVERKGQKIECWLDVAMLSELAGFIEAVGGVKKDQLCATGAGSEERDGGSDVV